MDTGPSPSARAALAVYDHRACSRTLAPPRPHLPPISVADLSPPYRLCLSGSAPVRLFHGWLPDGGQRVHDGRLGRDSWGPPVRCTLVFGANTRRTRGRATWVRGGRRPPQCLCGRRDGRLRGRVIHSVAWRRCTRDHCACRALQVVLLSSRGQRRRRAIIGAPGSPASTYYRGLPGDTTGF